MSSQENTLPIRTKSGDENPLNRADEVDDVSVSPVYQYTIVIRQFDLHILKLTL